MTEKNPYADESDKKPLPGKFKEFFEWERERELEKRKTLTTEEIKRAEDADERLDKKMNS